MSLEELFKQAVRHSKFQTEKLNFWLGEVASVCENTCTVEPYKNVRLNSVIDNLENYITIYPKIGSKVIVGRLENSDETFLVKTSEIEKISIKIGNQIFEMQNSKFSMKNQSADLKHILNEALTKLKNATIITPQGNGQLSPNDKQSLEQIKNKVNTLFK